MSGTWKEYIAGFFLLIFLALQTGVVLHGFEHDHIHFCHHGEEAVVSQSGHHCALCDYTITKYELNPVTMAGNMHILPADESFITSVQPEYSIRATYCFKRGPPAMA